MPVVSETEDRGMQDLKALRKGVKGHDLPEDPRDLPPIPDSLKAGWARLLASTCSPQTKLAVRYVLAGYSFEKARTIVGSGSRKNVYEAARRYGCLGDFNRLISIATSTARIGLERLEEALLNDEIEISARDLAVVTGVMIDKATNFEKLQRQGIGTDGPTFADALERLCSHVAETGGSVKASFEMTAGDGAIDVTPGSQVRLGPADAALPLLESTSFSSQEEALMLEVFSEDATQDPPENKAEEASEEKSTGVSVDAPPRIPPPERSVMDRLSDRQKMVLRCRNNWDGKGVRSLSTISKSLGVSSGSVRDLEIKTIKKIARIRLDMDRAESGLYLEAENVVEENS